MQRKVAYAGRAASSFAKAADLLHNLAGLDVAAKPVERLTRRIGVECVARRDEAVAAFEAMPLVEKFQAPAAVEPPELAVVFVDGGRLQIRERLDAAAGAVPDGQADWEPERPGKGHWREGKFALLATMQSQPGQTDPCVDVPAGFLDVLRIPLLARELGKVAAGGEAEAQGAEASTEGLPSGQAEYEPPEVGQRRVVASCRVWPEFAPMVAQAAWELGFQKATRRAFVADGSANNWRLRERFFGSFVPVLDFIHALSYVYAAATAGRSLEQGWECYQRWIGWVWKGEVAWVIEELRGRHQELGKPAKEEPATSVRVVVARALGYLNNHQDKMKYPEYRKEGLPITSSLMESVVKQMNYRVKGSEKFWCREGAEAIAHLRADHLSDGERLEEFWRQRQDNATGQRRYRRAA